ncbi:MAG: hypothetical protein US86_C0013G0021 [Candidatus Daviesbacteria bacterium GW2011_GWA2_38_24]|uniref:Uncharacterized protein n=1 Tax=Candidatus Daviesbacteria bacterium GW2011_GWA2_38_24 TaxID=1618422 RepID=A0A0G0JPH6_9BACT|nr:MAG: hypothetical protein US86_C0013G0021 [Candidatus Daviesbacteria bacterium GW2011_GWA2_38_24]KKQ79883.1 MAG: hypothetical protein UT01_C0025G0016 [Candidatus Daviesbacteria bacterium GW2011_GWA1_38_7]OGE23082.1 MAG: hypothetical protein A2688_03735 [Candidatus Daviesbacteria bacterium RIFCSPHIGHO2_01_FULL_38_8]
MSSREVDIFFQRVVREANGLTAQASPDEYRRSQERAGLLDIGDRYLVSLSVPGVKRGFDRRIR